MAQCRSIRWSLSGLDSAPIPGLRPCNPCPASSRACHRPRAHAPERDQRLLRRRARRARGVALDPPGRGARADRPLGMRQDDAAADAQPPHRADAERAPQRHDHARRRRHRRARGHEAAHARLDGLPAAQPVPDVDLRQRRLRPARAVPPAPAPARARAAGQAGAPARRPLRGGPRRARPPRAAPLRRPAAAAVHRARDRDRPRDPAHGRTVLGARPALDRGDRGPDPPAAQRARDRDRHPQPAAGAPRRRPRRVHVPRRPRRARLEPSSSSRPRARSARGSTSPAPSDDAPRRRCSPPPSWRRSSLRAARRRSRRARRSVASSATRAPTPPRASLGPLEQCGARHAARADQRGRLLRGRARADQHQLTGPGRLPGADRRAPTPPATASTATTPRASSPRSSSSRCSEPHASAWWVDNEVLASAPHSVSVRIGASTAAAPATLPKITTRQGERERVLPRTTRQRHRDQRLEGRPDRSSPSTPSSSRAAGRWAPGAPSSQRSPRAPPRRC